MASGASVGRDRVREELEKAAAVIREKIKDSCMDGEDEYGLRVSVGWGPRHGQMSELITRKTTVLEVKYLFAERFSGAARDSVDKTIQNIRAGVYDKSVADYNTKREVGDGEKIGDLIDSCDLYVDRMHNDHYRMVRDLFVAWRNDV